MRQLLLDLGPAPEPTFANFVHGANTELFDALAAAARGDSPERVIYVWGDSGAGKSHLANALAKACEGRPGVRVIDDVDAFDADQQATLFNDFIEGAFRTLVVTARLAPADVALRRDLATRLATGLVFHVMPLTDAQKRAALETHARGRGFALSEEVSTYLLTHARRDMGSLMAALEAIDRYSLETGRPVTVPLLKAAIQA
jgi:DnaA family protein